MLKASTALLLVNRYRSSSSHARMFYADELRNDRRNMGSDLLRASFLSISIRYMFNLKRQKPEEYDKRRTHIRRLTLSQA